MRDLMRNEEKWKSDYRQILATRIDLKMLVYTIESHSKVFTSNYIEDRKSIKILKKNYPSIDKNKCLTTEPGRFLYFSQSIICTNLTLTNKYQYVIAQFKLMNTRNNELSVFTLQFSSSPHVLRVDEQEFRKRSHRIGSLKSDSNLHPTLSQFQTCIQWQYITPNPMIMYYRQLYCFVITERSYSHERAISTSIWNSIPYGISIFIALMFGYIFGWCYN